MKNYFIYQYEDIVSSKDKLRITAIFIHQAKIQSQNTLAEEIKIFFQENSLTDKLVVVLPEYLDEASLKFFFDERDLTFLRIPGRSSEYFDRCLIVYQFKSNGELNLIFGEKP